MLRGVEICPFPLDCDIVVNTGGQPSTCDCLGRKLLSQVDGRPPVLTAISQSNVNGQNSTLTESKPLNRLR